MATPNDSTLNSRLSRVEGVVGSNVTNFSNANNSIYINAKYPPIPTSLTACKADGVTDDTTALQALINYCSTNKKKLYTPFGTYKTTAPLSIPSTKQGFYWWGDGNRNTIIDPHHNGNAIEMVSGQSHIVKDILISPQDVTYNGNYTGVYIKDGLLCCLDNVHIWNPKNGLVLEAGTYLTDVDRLYIYHFTEKGIYFKQKVDGTGPNGNNISIQYVLGTGSTTVGSCGIYIESGSVNTFSNGQVSDCERIVYQLAGTRNYYEKTWVEHFVTAIEIVAGNAYVDLHGANVNKVWDGARLFDNNGQSTFYLDLTKDQLKEDKSLKGLWFFNEGTGSRILDKSGNKKHLTLLGTPTWTTDGTWGTAVYYKHTDGRDISIPLDVVNWAQPYTFAMNFSVEVISGDFPAAVGLYLADASGNYFCAGQTKGSLIVMSYANAVLEAPAYGKTGRNLSSTTGRNIWAIVYVDPVAKTVEAIDPFGASPIIQLVNPIAVPIPTTAYITGRAHVSNTAEGNMSMVAFWQRKLSLNEVFDLVNNYDRPLKRFDKMVQLSTVLVSPNGSSYKVTVGDTGTLTTTLL